MPKMPATRSFYDITGSDSFTERIKIPEIVEQAERQLDALAGSGASGIEWRVANEEVVKRLKKLFRLKSLPIDVKYVP